MIIYRLKLSRLFPINFLVVNFKAISSLISQSVANTLPHILGDAIVSVKSRVYFYFYWPLGSGGRGIKPPKNLKTMVQRDKR